MTGTAADRRCRIGMLTAAQKAVARRIVRRHVERHAPVPTGELNIVPFLDVVVNLIMFLLMTSTAVLAVSEVDAQLPTTCRGSQCRGAARHALDAHVLLTDRGIYVSGADGTYGPGCTDHGPAGAPTVAARDWEGLGACIAALHAAHPDEDEIVISADPLVPYEDVVRAMDAVRERDGQALFGDVILSAGIR